MTPEEVLHRLLDRSERRANPLAVSHDELAASLAAAEVLAQLREIDVPPAFARQLEVSIRTRMRDLARQNGRSIPLARPLKAPGPQRFQ